MKIRSLTKKLFFCNFGLLSSAHPEPVEGCMRARKFQLTYDKLRRKNKTAGFILPLAIMIIFMAVTMLTNVIRRAFVFQDKVRFAFEREKARTLALGGLQIGMAQLSVVKPKDKDGKPGMPGEASQGAKTSAAQQSANMGEQAMGEASGEKAKLTPEQEWLK